MVVFPGSNYEYSYRPPAGLSIKSIVSAGQVELECSVEADFDPTHNFYTLLYVTFYRQLAESSRYARFRIPQQWQHKSKPEKLCLLENDITYYVSPMGNVSHYDLRHACESGEGFEGGRLSAAALGEMRIRLNPEPDSASLHFTVRLLLKDIMPADAGRYWCELTHPDFMPFSLLQPLSLRSVFMPVNPPHPWIESAHKHKTGQEKEKVQTGKKRKNLRTLKEAATEKKTWWPVNEARVQRSNVSSALDAHSGMCHHTRI